jgi:hypothetical protein
MNVFVLIFLGRLFCYQRFDHTPGFRSRIQHSMDNFSPSEMLEAIYGSEINFEVKTFWDAGFHWGLGDNMNGYHAEGNAKTFGEAVQQLAEAARRHFPLSLFALGEQKVSKVEPANANPVQCQACLEESGRFGPLLPPFRSTPEFDLLFAARRTCPKCGTVVVFERKDAHEA